MRVTEIDVGQAVVNNEDERALMPLSISPVPSGGSRLAWMGNDGRVHVTTLDQGDQATGASFGLPAKDFADIRADDQGGVILLTRDAQGSGAQHCGNLSNLCGPSGSLPSQWACRDMYLVRFDGSRETWATNLTDGGSQPPYLNGPTDSQRVVFIWEAYAHHGRVAFDGSNYAAYFGAAISVSERCVAANSTLTTGVNIHQGDRMRVVSESGALQTGSESGFGWGCSHSGYERVEFDPAGNRFVAVCKTDNNNRIALPAPYVTIRPVDLWYSNLGDLVPATGGGMWLTTSDIRPGQPANANGLADVLLLRFTAGAAEEEIVLARQEGQNNRAPHLAAYGSDRLNAAWEASSATGDLRRNDANRRLWVQTLSRATGAAEGEPFAVDVLGNRYQEFVGFPDGSVAFAAPGSTATKLKILRVMPCRG